MWGDGATRSVQSEACGAEVRERPTIVCFCALSSLVRLSASEDSLVCGRILDTKEPRSMGAVTSPFSQGLPIRKVCERVLLVVVVLVLSQSGCPSS